MLTSSKESNAVSLERLWNHIHQTYLFPVFEPVIPWKTATYSGLDVYYKEYIEVGGATFGQNFIPFLKGRGMPKAPRAFEWCAGAGFVGFSAMANGLCENLALADISEEAIKACRHTIAKNGITDRAVAYVSDNLRDIPRSEKWDLVLGNPPHHADEYIGDRRGYDEMWGIRREFYKTVAPFLNPGGVIVVCENNRASTLDDDFRGMIEDGGLKVVLSHNNVPERTREDRFYFIVSMRKDDHPPAWTRAS
jgi:16S rRNA G966 N2-methylase RsmD